MEQNAQVNTKLQKAPSISRMTLLLLIAFNVLAVLIRIYFIRLNPIQVDEVKIIEEALLFSWRSIPVQFVGYGNGEYLPVPLVARILTQFFQLDPLVAIRCVVLVANIAFINILFVVAKKLFDLRVAVLSVAFAAIWPWSIVAGSIGYNFFLIPALLSGAILLLIKYHEHERVAYLVGASLLLVAMCYTYPLGIVWSGSIIGVFVITYAGKHAIKRLAIPIGLFLLCTLPIVLFYLKNQLGLPLPDQILFFSIPHLSASRINQISIFGPAGLMLALLQASTNYLTHFNYWLLHHVLDSGNYFSYLAYAWDSVFIYTAIYAIIRKKAVYTIPFIWLMLYPIGSSVTMMNEFGFFMSRDVAGLPLLIMLSAHGCVLWHDFLRKKISSL